MEVEYVEVVDVATYVQGVTCGSHYKDAVIGFALAKAEGFEPGK